MVVSSKVSMMQILPEKSRFFLMKSLSDSAHHEKWYPCATIFWA